MAFGPGGDSEDLPYASPGGAKHRSHSSSELMAG